MSLRLNQDNLFTTRIAISTGPRGTQRGSFGIAVSKVRDQLIRDGLKIVGRNSHPEYVVVPDNISDPGKLDARPITFSHIRRLIAEYGSRAPQQKVPFGKALEKWEPAVSDDEEEKEDKKEKKHISEEAIEEYLKDEH